MADRILVVGGNAAGMTAASRAKRLDPSLSVGILEAGPRIAYSICGLPFAVAGLVGIRRPRALHARKTQERARDRRLGEPGGDRDRAFAKASDRPESFDGRARDPSLRQAAPRDRIPSVVAGDRGSRARRRLHREPARGRGSHPVLSSFGAGAPSSWAEATWVSSWPKASRRGASK